MDRTVRTTSIVGLMRGVWNLRVIADAANFWASTLR